MLLPKNAFCQNILIKKIIGYRLARNRGLRIRIRIKTSSKTKSDHSVVEKNRFR